ncbi:unnamed protein product [Rhizoctonia solani]|uniref:Methyltransferase n=1 Tax=Rhizoctonia solani TaxID=456999 RepID=A0A8H3H9V6_9AGAM|nr:uncharacterized protein RhiXN_07447 [Rhizoctonia solani]QRW25498.1 hypothetical protein RhiXN_07447 [Rhizoctonia solani]CAE6490725.1 unnamed protein product [Rhizoctonia solani]
MSFIETKINYFTPPADGSKPYQWVDEVDEPPRNWEAVEFPVKVENVRGREKEFTLDSAGFEFHTIPSREKTFESDESIRSVYYEDCVETFKKLTGASRVAIFDHTIRRPRPEGTPDNADNRQPVKMAHTPESAERRVKMHLPEADVPALLSKRYQLINLWRPIQVPAWQFPLALCDFQTVNTDKVGGDFVPTTLKYKDRDGEVVSVKYNENHQWKYLAGMSPDEIVLIKCFDSRLDGSVATFTPHTAIDDPTTPPDAPERHSIEIRALVFYD